MTLRVEPQPNNFGAIIRGIDLASAVEASDAAEQFAQLREIWLQYQVLAFPEQPLCHDALTRVTQAFGGFGHEPYLAPLDDNPRIVEIRRSASEQASPFGTSWHSDWSFQPEPPAATLLHSKIVPPCGGDTCFADGVRAFADLPAEEQDYLRTLTGIHSARRSYSPTGYFATDPKARSMRIRSDSSAYATQEHPIVRTHPESGREVLWLNSVYTIGIRELAGDAGTALIDRLCAHATQASYVYRHRWEPQTLVIWDNRSVQHCATGGYDGYERVMHRTTTAGTRPFLDYPRKPLTSPS